MRHWEARVLRNKRNGGISWNYGCPGEAAKGNFIKKTYRRSSRISALLGIPAALLWLTVSVQAANHYIRSGATGNGSDWTNASSALPTSLVRGDTYYIADGSYSGYTVDDAVSGTQVITLKKATAADHGTDTGWVSTYGDG